MCECNCVKNTSVSTTEVLDMVHIEVNEQSIKWGDQSHKGLFEWISILTEEVGEAAQAANDHVYASYVDDQAANDGANKLRDELIQVAAVAVNMLKSVL